MPSGVNSWPGKERRRTGAQVCIIHGMKQVRVTSYPQNQPQGKQLVEPSTKATGVKPCTKATDMEPCTKVILELTEPHSNCCYEPPHPIPDVNQVAP